MKANIDVANLPCNPFPPDTLHPVNKFLNERFAGFIDGVLLAGSRIYGVPRDDSDLDVIVSLSKPVRQRIVRRFGSLLVDISAMFSGEMLRAMHQIHSPGILECIARGQIVFDSCGQMAAIKQRARAIYNDGPPPLTAAVLSSLRARIANDLSSVERETNPATFGLIAAHIMLEAARVHYSTTRKWLPNTKSLLSGLSPQLQECANAFVTATEHSEKYEYLVKFVEAAVGGRGRHQEWETPMEQIDVLRARLPQSSAVTFSTPGNMPDR